MSVEVTEAPRPAHPDGQVPLIKVSGLKKYFPITQGILFQRHVGDVHAVDGVDLEVYPGETFGLVGETGCGKSTLARVVMRLYEATEGTIEFEGRDITKLKGRDLRDLRRDMQMIFQDPYASLNPRKTVGSIIGAPYRLHKTVPGDKVKSEVQQLMELVGLNPEHYNRYPHEFSGGQRQTDRCGTRARAAAQAHRLRRTGVRPRRVDPGPDPQPARRPSDRVQPDVPVHRPRPVRGQARVRPRGRDVPGQDRGDRRRRRAVQDAEAPLHGRAALGRAGGRPEAGEGEEADHPGRRRALPDRPSVGMPVPPEVSEGAVPEVQGR